MPKSLILLDQTLVSAELLRSERLESAKTGDTLVVIQYGALS